VESVQQVVKNGQPIDCKQKAAPQAGGLLRFWRIASAPREEFILGLQLH
jgi:hypothetical protein